MFRSPFLETRENNSLIFFFCLPSLVFPYMFIKNVEKSEIDLKSKYHFITFTTRKNDRYTLHVIYNDWIISRHARGCSKLYFCLI